MQGDQTVNGETGFWSLVKGASVWALTWMADRLSSISANQVATYLAIIYSTMLIISWFRREFKTPPRHVRVTDTAETIHAKKVVVVTEDEAPPELPPTKE